MVQRLKVNQLYTSASAIKGLMKAGDEIVRKYDRSSLRTIGSGMSCLLSHARMISLLLTGVFTSVFALILLMRLYHQIS